MVDELVSACAKKAAQNNMEKTNKNKILVVEDEQQILDGYSIALENEGFAVLKAENGQIGLDAALKEEPDLILLDIIMPVMDGLTMLQKLREKNDYGKNVSVILLTNLSAGQEDIVKKVAETAPVYYIAKADFTFRQVVDKIKEVLASKH